MKLLAALDRLDRRVLGYPALRSSAVPSSDAALAIWHDLSGAEQLRLYRVAAHGDMVHDDPSVAAVVSELQGRIIDRRRQTTRWMVGLWLLLAGVMLGLAAFGPDGDGLLFLSGLGPLLASVWIWRRQSARLVRAESANRRVAAVR